MIDSKQKDFRKRFKLRQIAVAKAAGINQSRLSLIENNWVKPSPDEVKSIEDAILRLAGQKVQNPK